jgi:hypothetical protein
MRLSAVDCLRRGWTSLSANWELVVVQWLGSFLVTALMALGLVLALLILGMNALDAGRWTSREVEEALRRLADSSPTPLMALTALLAIWLLTLLVHCYFQAATYGILTAADRQALPGARRPRLLFRTFSRRDFLGWGGLYVWRFFGMLVLFWGLMLSMATVVLIWLVSLGVGGFRWGAPAALGIGCGGLLPLGFLLLTLGLWFQVAQAGLAAEGAGVRSAARHGLTVLGRRLGTVIVLVFIFFAAALALAAVFAPVSLVTDSLLAAVPRVRTLVQVLLLLLQALPNTLLAVALAGSLVALVRTETRHDIRHRSPQVQIA